MTISDNTQFLPQLPSEVVFEIFKCLSLRDIVHNLPSTCKQAYALVAAFEPYKIRLRPDIVKAMQLTSATNYRDCFLHLPLTIQKEYWPEHPIMQLLNDQSREELLHILHCDTPSIGRTLNRARLFILYDIVKLTVVLGDELESARLSTIDLISSRWEFRPQPEHDLGLLSLRPIHDLHFSGLCIILRMLLCYYEEVNAFIRYYYYEGIEQLLIAPLSSVDDKQPTVALSQLTKQGGAAELSEACSFAANLLQKGKLWWDFFRSCSEQEEAQYISLSEEEYVNLLKIVTKAHRNIAIVVFWKLSELDEYSSLLYTTLALNRIKSLIETVANAYELLELNELPSERYPQLGIRAALRLLLIQYYESTIPISKPTGELTLRI
jgi:hypothetical protein